MRKGSLQLKSYSIIKSFHMLLGSIEKTNNNRYIKNHNMIYRESQ